MAQAGIHGLAGMAVRKWAPDKEWLMLGIVLGNFLPDTDNLAVAVATLMGRPTENLHRTLTHSLFFVAGIILLGYLLALILNTPRLGNLGLGLGIGVMMHIGLDLLIWFNGVALLWPLPYWVNLWEGVAVPEWFRAFLMPAEFLAFAVFLWFIAARAKTTGTDSTRIRGTRAAAVFLGILFIVFLVLVYTLDRGFMTPYGAAYLLCLGWVTYLVLRMRRTVDSSARAGQPRRV